MSTFNGSSGTMSSARVAVVAAGIVSPLGFGLPETLQNLRQATDCVTPVTRFSVANTRCKTAGQIPDQRLLANGARHRKRARLHRASHMMIAAMDELTSRDRQFKPELTVIGTTSGGMSFGENYYRAIHQHSHLRRSPEWVANYPPQKPVLDALHAFAMSTPCLVIATGSASGTNS